MTSYQNQCKEWSREPQPRCLRNIWQCCLLLLLSSYWISKAFEGIRTPIFFFFPDAINIHFLCSAITHISPKKGPVSCPCSMEVLRARGPEAGAGWVRSASFSAGRPQPRGEGRIPLGSSAPGDEQRVFSAARYSPCKVCKCQAQS